MWEFISLTDIEEKEWKRYLPELVYSPEVKWIEKHQKNPTCILYLYKCFEKEKSEKNLGYTYRLTTYSMELMSKLSTYWKEYPSIKQFGSLVYLSNDVNALTSLLEMVKSEKTS